VAGAALVVTVAGCAAGPGGASPSLVRSIDAPSPSVTAGASPALAAVRADIESRYMDQLLSIGDGARTIIV
jgi:hypothetical protein